MPYAYSYRSNFCKPHIIRSLLFLNVGLKLHPLLLLLFFSIISVLTIVVIIIVLITILSMMSCVFYCHMILYLYIHTCRYIHHDSPRYSYFSSILFASRCDCVAKQNNGVLEQLHHWWDAVLRLDQHRYEVDQIIPDLLPQVVDQL